MTDTTTRVTLATPKRFGRITATAHCLYCAWHAQHTGDDALETANFLRGRIFAHIAEAHPELPTDAQRRPA